METRRRRYLVAYDIREKRRLHQVHRTVKGFGWSMQYSVFLCDLDSMELIDLKIQLAEIIDHWSDSIAIIDGGLPSERGRTSFEFMGQPPSLPLTGPLII